MATVCRAVTWFARKAAITAEQTSQRKAAVSIKQSRCFCTSSKKLFSDTKSSSASNDKKEPAEWIDPEVQTLLYRMTGMDMSKIFHRAGAKPAKPKFGLVSEEKYQQLMKNAEKRAMEVLQMPPVMKEREPIDEVLSNDPEIAGVVEKNMVFVDISVNRYHRERHMVVRESSGVLRKASWEEKDRLLQVYFPNPPRKILPPPIFEEENIKNVLDYNRHVQLLDYCCLQFEPDSPRFIEVHHRVYEDIRKYGSYDLLRSTRHFGGMAYYLVKKKRADGLLIDMLSKQLYSDVVDWLQLYTLLHPNSKTAEALALKKPYSVNDIETYVKYDAIEVSKVETALEKALEDISTSSQETQSSNFNQPS